MSGGDTIYALSSGAGPSGVAVFRISGPQVRFVLETMAGGTPPERSAALRFVRDSGGEIIDRGIVLWFPGPASFTGEDCAEFHLHGGRAVISAMLQALGEMPGMRIAEPGEFSRRAFENGKMDLTELEGLSDLVAARTQEQRRQALAQSAGGLRRMLGEWRLRIVRMRAMVEAELDFADEEDVPDSVSHHVWQEADSLAKQIWAFLDDAHRGEIVREGFEVVLLGPPNAGKSSLMNALARREVAIVAEEAGTTRDLLEVELDLAGFCVVLVDTAGIREDGGEVELEGIRRARERARRADLAVWLDPPTGGREPQGESENLVRFHSKDDEGRYGEKGISVRRGDGLEPLLRCLRQAVRDRTASAEPVAVTRLRHRIHLAACAENLAKAAAEADIALELRAEMLREASDSIGRITGAIGVEDLLDVIFREFCIGK